MRYVLTAAMAFGLAVSLAAQGGGPVSHIEHDKIQAAIAKKGASIANLPELGIGIAASGRDKAGNPELHEGNSEIYYIVDGAGTFVAGGTLIDAKPSRPGHQTGSGIMGGTTYHLATGDSVVIPPMTPHQFTEIPKGISYFVVNVNKPASTPGRSAVVNGQAEENAVKATMDAMAQATIKKDIVSLEKIYRDDVTYSHSSGATQAKAEVLKAASGQTTTDAMTFSKTTIRIYGQVALFKGVTHILASSQNKKYDTSLNILWVLVKGPQGWQIVARQPTLLEAQ